MPRGDWHGHVGVVTTLIPRADFDPRARHRAGLRAGDHDALRRRRRCATPGVARRGDLSLDGAQHEMRDRASAAIASSARSSSAATGRCSATTSVRGLLRHEGDLTMAASKRKPSLAVWKFASCDGCQLTLLDCEDELLAVAGARRHRLFPGGDARRRSAGATTSRWSKARSPRAHDAERIQDVRRRSRVLVTIGACATAGGIQALRNFADVKEYASIVYARPDYIHTLATSTADRRSRARSISSCAAARSTSASWSRWSRPSSPGASPVTPPHSVCIECKLKGNVCVMVAHGTPCLGPVTHAGCGALCPSYDRGCYGCFGPEETPNAPSLSRELRALGMDERDAQARLSHLQRQRRGIPQGERAPWRVRPSRSTISPASRAKARSRSWCATAW